MVIPRIIAELRHGFALIQHARSFYVGSTLFGGAYSGLEYDYRGVKKCYQSLQEADKVCVLYSTRIGDNLMCTLYYFSYS